MILGVDVGGTFTDAALLTADALVTAKAPTTPEDQSEGVLRAVREALDRAGARPDRVERFVHGMTVATNALLEGRVARTALLATEGFTDVEELGRQARAELYRLCASHPPPLVPAELRVAVPERTGPDGVLRELDERALAGALRGAGLRVRGGVPALGLPAPGARAARGRARGARPSRRARVRPRTRRRACSASTSAARPPWSTPPCRRCSGGYLERLVERCEQAGLPEPEVMLSSGGAADVATAARHAAWTVLSGPAGGAVGAARGGRAARASAMPWASTWAAPPATSR